MSSLARRIDPDYPSLLPAVLRAPSDVAPMRRTTRDWIVDVLCFLLAGLISLMAFTSQYHWEGLSRWTALDLIVGIGCWMSLWFRRRWPVALCLVSTAAGVAAVSVAGPALALLFTVAVHRRLPAVVLVGALNVCALFPFYVIQPDSSLPYWGAVVLSMVIEAAVVAWGMFVRARRQLIWSLRERAVRAESEQALRVEQARRRERERIAREMHDVLAHRISLLSLHAGALEFRPDAAPAEIGRAAGVIRSSAHQALQELREVISVLRDDPSEDPPERPQPTIADLSSLVEESRAAGTRVELTIDISGAELPASTGRTAYRIVQEGLTNARKHAHGVAVRVRVGGDEREGLRVVVSNPLPVGVPAAVIPGAGSGLIGLAERVGLAGGTLKHGRDHTGTFRLDAWLPWLPPATEEQE
ncbi:MAG TPA: histidine kinase [Mycobacteriales bacterium]|nr:histidine kinase [Mycobacteriales bacterium]